jgi:hypothetical protein
MELNIYIYITNVYAYVNILLFQTENEKWKPRRFSLICLPFAHCANGSCHSSEETIKVIYFFANGLNGLAQL